ncbi:MAG: LysR family transcriptional regulator, partial [Pseudomonadota bacterium]|nr:LysR family transcriptional regulator [Pseudomonadota bacterium]
MSLSRTDLADFAYFIAIAKHRSFRKAALEMGVSSSALSHAMTALEERRGVRLLNRTTRSVSLTAAGEELQTGIQASLETIGDAAERLDRYRDEPAGRIRINVLEDAVPLLLEPVMPVFVERYPEVEVDVSVSNRLIDVIDSGFDAGIRYGGT